MYGIVVMDIAVIYIVCGSMTVVIITAKEVERNGDMGKIR